MIVKLRESYIAKLERMRKKEKGGEGEEEDTKDREMVCHDLISNYVYYFIFIFLL